MTFIATGDLHVTPFSHFSRSIDAEGLTPLGRNILETGRWLSSLAKDSYLLHNGDFTTTPGRLDSSTLFLLAKLDECFAPIPEIILSLGNHDIENKVGLHNLHLFSRFGKYRVPDNNKVLHVDRSIPWGEAYKKTVEGGLYVVPFTYSLEDQSALLRSIPDGSVVAVHTPIAGAFLHGDTSEEHGIPLSEFRRFRLTLASHYHTPQIFDPNGDRTLVYNAGEFQVAPGSLVVLGTPLPHSFADVHPTYGAWAVDPAKLTVRLIENPHAPRYIILAPSDNLSSLDFSFENRPVYVSITAPAELHTALSKTPIKGVTGVALKREAGEAPPREGVTVRAGVNEDILTTLLSYLDSKQVAYQRDFINREVSAALTDLPPSVTKLGGLIRFENLEIENFMSWDKAQVRFEKDGLRLVSGVNYDTETAGSNGGGKSSLLESLIWAVYGETLRDSPNKSAVIRAGEKQCRVGVEFQNGKRYKVVRTRTATKTVASLYLHEESGWRDISEGNANEATKQIAQALGIPLEDFLLTSFFGSKFGGKFPALKDSEKKQFLSRVFELETYEKLLQLFRQKHSGIRNALNSAESILATTQTQLESIEASYQEKLIAVEGETQERQSSIARLQALVAQGEVAKGSLTSALEQERATLKEREESLQKASGDLNQRIHSRVHLSQQRQMWERQQEELIEEIAHLQPTASTCSTCGQALPPEPSSVFESRRLAKEEKLRKVEKDLAATVEALAGTEQDILLEEVHTLQESRDKVQQAVTQSETVLRKVSDALLTNRTNLEALQGLPDPKDKLKEFEHLLATLRSSVETHKGSVEKYETILGQYNLLVNALGPTGVVSYVLDNAILQVNQYLKLVSETLFGGDYEVWLSSTKELQDGRDANIITLSYSTPGGSFGMSSDGERRKAEIALFLALNYLLSARGTGSTNLVILDEALDSLDAQASASTIEALSKFAKKESKCVLLVSHSDGVTSLVDQNIVVEKRGGISKLRGEHHVV